MGFARQRDKLREAQCFRIVLISGNVRPGSLPTRAKISSRRVAVLDHRLPLLFARDKYKVPRDELTMMCRTHYNERI
jgi:hypothetical protein